MNNPKGYRCANCGNMLPISHTGIMKCPSCGSEYKVDEDYKVIPFRIDERRYEMKTIAGRVEIPSWLLRENPQEAFHMSLEKMARGMAEKFVPLMEIQTHYDIDKLGYTLYGSLKVGVPEYSPEEEIRRALSVNPEIVNAERW